MTKSIVALAAGKIRKEAIGRTLGLIRREVAGADPDRRRTKLKCHSNDHFHMRRREAW